MASFTQQEAKECFKKARRILKHTGLDILLETSDKQRLLVVTPRHIGNAVKRNKIRRQLKEIMRAIQPANSNCIIIVKKEALTYSFEDLTQLIASVFKSGS